MREKAGDEPVNMAPTAPPKNHTLSAEGAATSQTNEVEVTTMLVSSSSQSRERTNGRRAAGGGADMACWQVGESGARRRRERRGGSDLSSEGCQPDCE